MEADEVLRPWAFSSAEDAMSANPSRSRLSPDQIAEGLALSEGALEKRRAEFEVRQERQRAALEPGELDPDDEDENFEGDSFAAEDDDYVDPEANAKRSRNRSTPDIYENAKPVVDEEAPEEEAAPVRRPRRRRS